MHKKKIGIMLLVLVLAFVFTACGRVNEAASDVQVADEVQQEIGAEENNRVTEGAEVLEEEDGTTDVSTDVRDAVGDCCASDNQAHEVDAGAGWAGIGTIIFIPNSDVSGFDEVYVELEDLTAENIIDTLIAHGALPEGLYVLDFAEVEYNGQTALELDLSADFENYLNSRGSSGEYYALGSVVNSFLSAFGSDSIRITVTGETLETGHAGEIPGFMFRFE
ncbi:MAG: GerMN domain-containing protein [Lachnospiraceae bacterium]|nr:GerMN domain-containing protein [Lachnospiraceae bacterium]